MGMISKQDWQKKKIEIICKNSDVSDLVVQMEARLGLGPHVVPSLRVPFFLHKYKMRRSQHSYHSWSAQKPLLCSLLSVIGIFLCFCGRKGSWEVRPIPLKASGCKVGQLDCITGAVDPNCIDKTCQAGAHILNLLIPLVPSLGHFI